MASAAWPETNGTPKAESAKHDLRPTDPIAIMLGSVKPDTLKGAQPDATPQADSANADEARDSSDHHFGLKATLYITTKRDSGKDSIGCRVIPMRTAAVDGKILPRRSILYIKETVGLKMPDGQVHDGYWYATDVGSAINRGRIDLYTGKGAKSITPYLHLNLKTLTVTKIGTFSGCPRLPGVTVAAAD